MGQIRDFHEIKTKLIPELNKAEKFSPISKLLELKYRRDTSFGCSEHWPRFRKTLFESESHSKHKINPQNKLRKCIHNQVYLNLDI